MRRAVLASLVWLLPIAVLAAEPVTTVMAVRHAEKASDQGEDPHLTAAGRRRAKALAALVAGGAPVGGLYSSEYHRTRETLVPLSDRLGLEIEVIPAGETNERLTTAWLAAEHPGQVVVVAGHSNTIPRLVEALTGTPTADLDESVYDALFVVSIHADGSAHVLRLSYGEPGSGSWSD